MEKFREIEVDLQKAIEEVYRIPTLFDYYLEERNEYHKSLENDMFAQRDKLSKELSTLNKLNQQNLEKKQLLQQKIDKAIEYIENMPYAEVPDEDYENNHKMVEWDDRELLKILRGEE